MRMASCTGTGGRESDEAMRRKGLGLSWDKVRQDFFPRWDRPGKWRLSLRKPIGRAMGQCCAETKTIRIGVWSSDPDERDLLLIHEICHAVAGGGHGLRWQRRMLRAAHRAGSLGRQALAALLAGEVEQYQQDGLSHYQQVYNQVEEAARSSPSVTYSALRRYLAGEYAVPVSEFDQQYRRAKRVFAEARQEQRRRSKLRAAMMLPLSAEADLTLDK